MRILALLLIGLNLPIYGQVLISGSVHADGLAVEFASVQLAHQLELTDAKGKFSISSTASAEDSLVISYLGFATQKHAIADLDLGSELRFELIRKDQNINPIVVTGNRSAGMRQSSAVIVHVLSKQQLDLLQATELADGLRFQSGLRVETDCQTCNYTQLRMNGLGGGYSQILINGRAIFSSLLGLYGLEQLPTGMVDRIETIKGASSALYGSSAIGGTVNIITRQARRNKLEFRSNYQQIGSASEYLSSIAMDRVNKNKTAGISLFANHRYRQAYDHNGDRYSELPEITSKGIGIMGFFLPAAGHKVDLQLHWMQEYRYGGEMEVEEAIQAGQAEERLHDTYSAALDYKFQLKDNAMLNLFGAVQATEREHYTGILPDNEAEVKSHLNMPPIGTSHSIKSQIGVQFNHRPELIFKSKNKINTGLEWNLEDIRDAIPSYNYSIDQRSLNLGYFIQSDWDVFKRWKFQSGLRLDKHSLLDMLVLNPRFSILHQIGSNEQWRLTYGEGFRAPQAFDSDLHIAFAGGGVSRVTLDPELQHEKSYSFSTSWKKDMVSGESIYGFTIESFATRLERPFALALLAEDSFGLQFEKTNGKAATVAGLNLEARLNYRQKVEFECGLTLQKSRYDEPIVYLDAVEGQRNFLRSPDSYGFARLSYFKNEWTIAVNTIYTGPMLLTHYAGAPEQESDAYVRSRSFYDLNFRLQREFHIGGAVLGAFCGSKNVLNSYQSDFDSGKNRDSNYVYGPSLPRAWYIGLKWSN